MVPTCAAPAAVNSTAALGQLLHTSGGNGINFGADVQCTAQQAAFQDSPAAINHQLFCGFYQVTFCSRIDTSSTLAGSSRWRSRTDRLPTSRELLCSSYLASLQC